MTSQEEEHSSPNRNLLTATAASQLQSLGSCLSSRYRWKAAGVSPPHISAGTGMGTPEELPYQNHLLGGGYNRTHQDLHNIDRTLDDNVDCDEDVKKENFRPPKVKNCSNVDESLLFPEDKSFLLPRSSPVISRRRRPLSLNVGGTERPAPSSLDSSPLDQPWCLPVTSMEDLGSKSSPPLQEDKKLRCVSFSSSLYRLLSAGLHLPSSGQQGLAEVHRHKGLTSCDMPPLSGHFTSTHNSKNRPCSGIPEFPADIFTTSSEVERENIHFIVADMVLEVLEGVKWTLSFDPRISTMDTHKHTSRAENTTYHKKECRHTQTSHRKTHSFVHTHRQTQDEEEEESTENDKAKHQPKSLSVLSTDSGFEDYGANTMLTLRDPLRNTEWLAQQLVLEFRRNWLPFHEPQCGQQSLSSSLQELPGTGGVVVSSSSLTEEIKLRTRMRGSLNWAPPRFQIIFTVQPAHRRSDVVALQHFLCAGCGTEVESKHIKKLRYCEYLGRYFCDCCHSGSEAVIPGRVLSCADFGRYPVSDFSKQLLESVWHQPLFDLTCVGKTLYSRMRELGKFRELQDQLLAIKKLLTVCRLSRSVITEFDQLPVHLMEQPHLFSMDDLLRVKKGQLVVQAKAVLHAAINHVENCELCLARGFICEFCRKRDIIFPFQSDICLQCPVCRACFHKHCFVEKKCPKCARIQSRKVSRRINEM